MQDFRISTNREELDIPLIHKFLSEESHWAKGTSMSSVSKAVGHSMCFGGFLGDSQVAFGRVVTDYTRFGYLMDIFVLPEYRGHGYGRAIVQAISQHPDLQTVILMLRTSSAAGLYEQLGFLPLPSPGSYMRRAALPQDLP